jgi:cell division septation protein DedD
VIGLAAREEANAQAEAQKHSAAGLPARVVYSSNWSKLTPNYYQVVYGVFANRADTAALRRELDQRGIKTYVMHSGQRVRP